MPETEKLTPEQEKIDGWLRQGMSHEPLPTLSPGFEDRLARRLRPRRLTAAGRLLLVGYTVLAVALSVWMMRRQSIDWPLIAAACVVPVLIIGALYGRRLHPVA